MQLKKKKSPVHIQNCDQVEALQRQKHVMVAVFAAVTGLMVFEMLFKITQSWVLHLETWRRGDWCCRGCPHGGWGGGESGGNDAG